MYEVVAYGLLLDYLNQLDVLMAIAVSLSKICKDCAVHKT